MRRLLIAVFCLVVYAGFASSAGADGGPSPGVSQGWDGALAPGGQVRYVAIPAGKATAVAVVRVRGGRVLRFGELPGRYGVPLVAFDGSGGGLSPDGRRLVLAQVPAASPFPSESRFAVLDTKRLRLLRTVTLRGTFSFDALSPDGMTLYLIQHLSARDFSRYAVRAYDLAAGHLLPEIIADRRRKERTMSGYPLTRTTSRDGSWVYTLYRNDGAHPFIHALDTRRRQAVCIDLPWRGNQDALWKLRMALSPDQGRLLLRRRSGDPVATIDTRTFRVLAAVSLNGHRD